MHESESVGRVTTRMVTIPGGFTTQSGAFIPEHRLAYEVYGDIDSDRSNVVLVFHALTGSQHAAGHNPEIPEIGERWTDEMHLGWWDGYIGPNRGIDTTRYAALCVNYLGGCYGSTGPSSVDPDSGEAYGSRFPELTLTDMVDSQIRLLDHLGIEQLHAVVGGSVGGMMAEVLATRYPDRVRRVIPLAASFETSSLQVLHNFEQMFAIVSDPDFKGGDYYPGGGPELGLALARMVGHKTFVSLDALRDRARDEVMGSASIGGYSIGHPLESYMLHQGKKFVRRFDANTYLVVMKAWQQFDLVREVGGMSGSLESLLGRCRNQLWQLFTIDSDVCYYPEEQERAVTDLRQADVPVRRFTIHSEKGHDSFLIEPELYTALLRDALDGHW